MSFFVFGVNHKKCPVEIREKLHFSEKRQREALGPMKEHADLFEFVILSTCNRVEFYGFSEDLALAHDRIFSLITTPTRQPLSSRPSSRRCRKLFINVLRKPSKPDHNSVDVP